MGKLLGFVGTTLGSMLGRWTAARVGVRTGFFCSVIGGGVGLYYARRWAQDYLP